MQLVMQELKAQVLPCPAGPVQHRRVDFGGIRLSCVTLTLS